jgi:hypothetical protein
MSAKIRALTVWVVLPYFVLYIGVPGVLSLTGRYLGFGTVAYWAGQPKGLAICAVPAISGIVILWLMPIRRSLVGIFTGALLAVGIVILMAWISFNIWEGFEERASIVASTSILLAPSALAGAFAGLLRSRDQVHKEAVR